ncbi:hypothetical protein D3C72_1483330 [compost metagenome]
MDTGTASSGMMEARQVCKKTMTTSTTRITASIRVRCTAWMESRTNTVGSHRYSNDAPCGRVAERRSSVLYTSSATPSALAPGVRKMPMAAMFWLSSAARRV